MSIKNIVRSIIRATKKKEIIPIEHPVSENNQFEGKVALISGGTGGIGMDKFFVTMRK